MYLNLGVLRHVFRVRYAAYVLVSTVTHAKRRGHTCGMERGRGVRTMIKNAESYLAVEVLVKTVEFLRVQVVSLV